MKKHAIFISEELYYKWRQAMADDMGIPVETISDIDVVTDLEHWVEKDLPRALDEALTFPVASKDEGQ